MPRLKTDKQGRQYYEDGAGDKVASFVQSFMGTLQAGMQLSQQKKSNDANLVHAKLDARMKYNSLTPDAQTLFTKSQTPDVLTYLGLMEEIPQAERPQDGGGKKEPKFRLRPDAIRKWTSEELAQKERDKATIATAVDLADQAVETGKVQLEAMRQNLKIGAFDFETRKSDTELRDALRKSDSPFERSLGWDKPVDQFILEDLSKQYPDMTERVMQQKFDIGPQARNAAMVRATQEGMQLFGDAGAAKKYAAAVVQAQYEGKYDLLNGLDQKMKTTAAQQLQLGWANYQEGVKGRIQSEAHFKMQIVNSLMQQSGYTLNSDTAGQLAGHVMYGTKLSEGAETQYKGFIEMAQTKMGNEAEALFTDVLMKRSQNVRESIKGVRETIQTLLDERKAGVGNKKQLGNQIELLSDKIVEIVAKDMGLDPMAAKQPVWRDAIMSGVKTMFGTGSLAGQAVGDKISDDTSLGGRVFADAVGPSVMGFLGEVWASPGNPVNAAGALMQNLGGNVTQEQEMELLGMQKDWDGTQIGKWLNEKLLTTPGVRILMHRHLEDGARKLIQTKERATNPEVITAIDERLLEIKKILEGIRK